jgi:hypothetical protein
MIQKGIPIDRDPVRTQSMSQLPEYPSPPLPVSPARLPGQIPGPVAVVPPETGAASAAAVLQPPPRIPRWLERAELFIRVLLRMWVGIIVCLLPWWPLVWDENPLFSRNPTLGSIVTNGAVRGLVSGLGLLNLWVAFRDAMGKGKVAELKK